MSTIYPKQATFKRNAHINYFKRCLRALPTAAEGHDSNRITIAFFCLSGLDLLGALEVEPGWIEWVWSLQSSTGGFRGSTFDPSSPAHLPSTYTALLVLALLRAPLDRLNIPGLLTFLKSCRNGDSYSPLPIETPTPTSTPTPTPIHPSPTASPDPSLPDQTLPTFDFQADVRMTYCASVICDIIRHEGAQGSERFLNGCRTWEGGYAAKPGNIEAQGGTTYCAIASLLLLSQPIPDIPSILRWATQRQLGGFQGRPGKLEDVCYSFWIGATIQLLSSLDSSEDVTMTASASISAPGQMVDRVANKAFLLSAQSPIGGFGKDPEDMPDPYHSYLALAALALNESRDKLQRGSQAQDSGRDGPQEVELGLKRLDPLWNISCETKEWLKAEMDRVLSRWQVKGALYQ